MDWRILIVLGPIVLVVFWAAFNLGSDVSTRRVSPVITFSGIRSLHRVGKSG